MTVHTKGECVGGRTHPHRPWEDFIICVMRPQSLSTMKFCGFHHLPGLPAFELDTAHQYLGQGTLELTYTKKQRMKYLGARAWHNWLNWLISMYKHWQPTWVPVLIPAAPLPVAMENGRVWPNALGSCTCKGDPQGAPGFKLTQRWALCPLGE